MSIFKRGNVYWYHFLFNGEHVQKSTGAMSQAQADWAASKSIPAPRGRWKRRAAPH
jgi:hypothetical protein